LDGSPIARSEMVSVGQLFGISVSDLMFGGKTFLKGGIRNPAVQIELTVNSNLLAEDIYIEVALNQLYCVSQHTWT